MRMQSKDFDLFHARPGRNFPSTFKRLILIETTAQRTGAGEAMTPHSYKLSKRR
jgi:hypothetical protein